VRVPDNDAKLILRLLDMGAQGIQVPHIEGLEGARRAVNAVRYPPLGQRGGAGTTRAAGYGSLSWSEHVQSSNREILLTVMTEDLKGIADIEAIAALDGVDLISLGPTDLSTALGITDPKDPRLRQQVEELVAKSQSHRQSESISPRVSRGFLPDAPGVGADGSQLHFGGPPTAHYCAACPAGIGPAHSGAGAAESWRIRAREYP